MRAKHTTELDFDTWADLARTDPDEFERMRLEAIDAFIESVPERNRERLRRFQWRIDVERRRAKTPLAACIRLSSMMWQSLLGDGGLRDRFTLLAASLHGEDEGSTRQKAQVLAFVKQGSS